MTCITEGVARRCSVKTFFWKISQNSLEKICVGVRPKACNFIKKETPTRVCYCQFWEIFKNTFFHRKPPVASLSITLNPSKNMFFFPCDCCRYNLIYFERFLHKYFVVINWFKSQSFYNECSY